MLPWLEEAAAFTDAAAADGGRNRNWLAQRLWRQLRPSAHHLNDYRDCDGRNAPAVHYNLTHGELTGSTEFGSEQRVFFLRSEFNKLRSSAITKKQYSRLKLLLGWSVLPLRPLPLNLTALHPLFGDEAVSRLLSKRLASGSPGTDTGRALLSRILLPVLSGSPVHVEFSGACKVAFS
jgi:hypothetical protein